MAPAGRALAFATAIAVAAAGGGPTLDQARAQEQATRGMPVIRDTEIEQLLRDYASPILKAAGLAWEESFVAEAARWRFAGVWRLQPIELDAQARADRVRLESPERRAQLHGLIGEIYRALGVEPLDFAPGAAARLQRAAQLLSAAR